MVTFVSNNFGLSIENLKHDPMGQAWQNGRALAAQIHGRAVVYKHRLCGSL